MRILIAVIGLLPTALWAQSPEAPPPPPLPEQQEQAAEAAEQETDVVIRKRGEETIEEYRVNGRVVMIKITPKIGPSYYLLDNDGDGSLETYHGATDSPPIVQWRVLQW